jgi:DNA polymerase III subunit epsilon
MTILLFFDVETSGLLPNQKAKQLDLKNLEQYPYILQISYILYDLERNMVIEKYNHYIRNPKIEVSAEITELTGITKELMVEKGVYIEDALETFKCAFLQCSYIIAHNIEFDSKMITIETERNRPYLQTVTYSILSTIESNIDITKECTMQMTVDFCNIERVNSRGVYKKLPRLSELYQILFGTTLENFHNSMVDVFACIRCYLKYKYDYTIEESEFKRMISDALS